MAIAHDDDDAGRKWRDRVLGQLRGAGIEARVVDLDLDTSAGLSDIGDWITRELVENAREQEGVAASLDDAWDWADPWFPYGLGRIWNDPRTWKPVEHIATGLHALDILTGGGLRTSGVHLVTGKAGRAKTQTSVQIAANVALAGTPVGIVSLELNRHEVARLILAQTSDVPRQWIDRGDLHGQALDREKLAALVADGVQRFGWRLVVLDYLGLLAAVESDRSDFTADLLNSTALRRIARKHDIALIVVAALRKTGTSKKALEQGPSIDRTNHGPGIHGGCAMNLWPHQTAAIEAIEGAIGRGRHAGVIANPTGTGKSVLGVAVARRCTLGGSRECRPIGSGL